MKLFHLFAVTVTVEHLYCAQGGWCGHRAAAPGAGNCPTLITDTSQCLDTQPSVRNSRLGQERKGSLNNGVKKCQNMDNIFSIWSSYYFLAFLKSMFKRHHYMTKTNYHGSKHMHDMQFKFQFKVCFLLPSEVCSQ